MKHRNNNAEVIREFMFLDNYTIYDA